MPTDEVKIRLSRILEAGLEFHEFIWFGDRQKVRRYLKRHGEEARFKERSFSKFFDRVMPVKVLHEHQSGRRFGADELRKMNLTTSDLKELAGIEDKREESEESEKTGELIQEVKDYAC